MKIRADGVDSSSKSVMIAEHWNIQAQSRLFKWLEASVGEMLANKEVRVIMIRINRDE